MIGVGIIGAGGIARGHAKAYQADERMKLIAFADVDPEAAKSAAEAFSVEACGVEDLLEHRRIQAVSICTPPTSHADLAVAALERGKHVLIEKPVATTLADAQRIRAAVEKAGGLKALVGQSHRFWPANQAAKRILDRGLIGQVVTVRDEIFSSSEIAPGGPLPWRFRKDVAGGGVVMDNGIHAIDRLRYWLGREIESLEARMWNLTAGADVEDAAFITLSFAPRSRRSLRTSALINLNRRVPKAAGRCVAEFVGTRGSLWVETWGEVRWCTGDGQWRPVRYAKGTSALALEVKSFGDSILEDLPVAVSVDEATRSLEWVLRAYESASRNSRL